MVGESGSGKTTLSRLLLGIESPTQGSVSFRGVSLPNLSQRQHRSYRHAVTAVFQNPHSSLDPRMRIWQLITEQLMLEGRGNAAEMRQRAAETGQLVGLRPDRLDSFPHQLSGGQRQRVAIARALVVSPEVIVLDEAISSLDVSVRAQIINLLLDLQERLGLTYVFIAHNLAIVQHLCHRTVVMYRGRIVEEGESQAIFDGPAHPYTAALIEASYLGDAPVADWVKPFAESGQEPPLGGCIYQPRCPIARPHCSAVAPENRELKDGQHVLCHFPLEVKTRRVGAH